MATGAVGWGLGSLTTSWGYPYAYSYANPYYDTAVVTSPAYDYSQPIVINDYSTTDNSVTDNSQTAAEPEPPPVTSDEQAAYELSDKALASFKAGNFPGASAQMQQAILKLPNDPVLHELSALCMFALREYGPAAAILNNFLAVAPGMDWTTLSGLYSDTDVYEQQLDALDNYCDSHPTDASAHFVLAYHRLICGQPDEAIDALKVVVQQQPKDQVAQHMLASLGGDEQPADTAAPADTSQSEQVADSDSSDSDSTDTGPTTDLIGPWKAERDDAAFDLTLDEDGNFVWKSAVKGQDPIDMKGTYTLSNDLLILDGGDQGTMIGRATPNDTDRFTFKPVDSPPSDKGLSFGRIKR